jgi:hypothetical protein
MPMYFLSITGITCVGLMGDSYAQTANNWSTYQYPAPDYTLKYPPTWKVAYTVPGVIMGVNNTLESPTDENPFAFRGEIVDVTIEKSDPLGDENTTQDIASRVIGDSQHNEDPSNMYTSTDFKYHEVDTNSTIGGLPAVKTVTESTDLSGKTTTYETTYELIRNVTSKYPTNYGYMDLPDHYVIKYSAISTLGTASDLYKSNLANGQAILDSIRFPEE